jgi:hypothetical protein
MPLTPNLSTVTVSGTYVDVQGNAIAGQVKFTPRSILTDASYDQIIIPITQTVTLNASGSFSITLPVTDDPDILPTGFTYLVEESFSGGRTYDISIPVTLGNVNLADVVPALPATGAGSQYVLLSSYATLNTQVQGMVATTNTATSVTTSLQTAITNASTAATQATNTSNTATEYLNALIHPFLLMGV